MDVENAKASRNIIADAADQVGTDTIRIFVGGLGEGVSDDDLRRMFVALGSVDEIEIIRSKGRSMAYLNFTPSSAKSLAKLFSSFNGCVWKGGRLRIEKAKEHYLVKMEREREKEREEELARNEVAKKCTTDAADVVSLKKPSKGHVAEKEQLRIFFPKLRKVKPLPFNGCGKHKYSFRNIPVPPLPTHFCDCELHSVPYDAPIGTGIVNSDAPQSGVDEKEFDLMHSVLNKLISKDGNSTMEAEGAEPNKNTGPSDVSDDILASDENAPDSEPDEDGIIINISGTMKETDFSWKSKDKKVSEYQGSNDNHLRTLEVYDKRLPNSNQKRNLDEGSNETNNHSLKRKKDDPNARSILPLGSHPLQAKKSKWKELVGLGSDSSFKLSNVLSRGVAQESVQQEDTEEESSKSEELVDETEASTDESMQDTEEESSKMENSDDVVEEESTDELAKQEGTEDESIKSEESDDAAEESTDELAQQEVTKEESSRSEDHDVEAEASAEESLDDSVQQEDSDKGVNLAEEVFTEDASSESTQDSLEQDKLEVESSKSDELDNSEKAKQSNGGSSIHQNNFEHPVTKPEENKQQEGVKLTDTEDGSVKKGATWSQIMPWTQLVSDLDNNSFSISQILPDSSANQVVAKPSLEFKGSGTRKSSKAVKVETAPVSDVYLTNTTTDFQEQKNLSNSAHHSESSNPFGAIKSEDEKATARVDSALKPVVKAETYESRPFVRCAASLKEWAKYKEALRRSRTKKRKIVEE